MSFHEDMLAEVGIGHGLPESFRVRNGHAGYILAHAHTIKSLFYSAIVSTWRTDCVKVGVDVLFHHGSKLVGDRTAKSQLAVVKIPVADHLTLHSPTCEKLEHVTL